MTGPVDPAVYRKAADVIRTGGLCKGITGTLDGQHCTLGAVMAATGASVWGNTDCVDPYAEPLAQLLGPGDSPRVWEDITRWNDREETTSQDVITLLEQAAEKVEADR